MLNKYDRKWNYRVRTMYQVERCSPSRRVGITPTTTHVAMTVRMILPETRVLRVGRPKSPPKLVTHGFCDSSEQIYYKLQNAF